MPVLYTQSMSSSGLLDTDDDDDEYIITGRCVQYNFRTINL